MGSEHIQDTRVKALNQKPDRAGDYVLYWMQQSQRAEWNHALEFAIQQANLRQLPLLVCFGLMDNYPEANTRHYRFMLEGLRETELALRKRGIKLVLKQGDPSEVALEFSKNATLLVCDRGYLRHQKLWRTHLAKAAACHVVQVESDVVVPVEEASDKAEFAARTIRPKIQRLLAKYLIEVPTERLKESSLDLPFTGMDLSNVDVLLGSLNLDRNVPAVNHFFPGGTAQANRKLRHFLEKDFGPYVETRNQPQTDHVSYLSMHLHFGQISPLQIALAARNCSGHVESKASFLEELIVRRELAQNYTEFTPDYDQFSSLPKWAKQTLSEHQNDPRVISYTKEQLDAAQTHDPYWNAAMQEMKFTGYMHNSMRMYWGKKILEWTRTPEEGYQITLALNNRYFLDGRDPNAYANVAWVFGLHDRPWGERPIFGKIRYMNAAGLERKCDIKGYVRKVERLVNEAKANGITFAS